MEEKKTMKERVANAKEKAQNFWERNKKTIIKGTVAAAVTVGGIVLFKKASDALEDSVPDATPLDIVKELPKETTKVAMTWEEAGISDLGNQITEKFNEINTICNDNNVGVNVMTSFGFGDESWDGNKQYLGIDVWRDKEEIMANW